MVGFERRLAAMERDGQLMPNRKGVLLLATKLDFVAGKVLGHRDGFGFLLRDDGGPDLFLSPREMLKVLHGDRVLVKPGGEYRGKPEGTIVEVIERRTNKLVGRFLHEHGLSIVVPEDQRIKHDILIPPSDTNGAQHGQVVSVEIMAQPTRHTQPLGRVSEVLGEIDDPGMEIEIAVRKFDVPVEFSEAARKQAARLPDVVRKSDLKDRVDLRDVPLITIDGEDARDFDDAVYCEPVELGTGQRKRPGWRLLVAIADVSHYVRPGDALDDDALERGTSVYFPRRVIPMLPESLSNGLCSLNPEVDRLVLVCDMVIPASGAGPARSPPTSSTTRSCTRMPAPPTPTSGPRCNSPAGRPRMPCARSCRRCSTCTSFTSCWRRAAETRRHRFRHGRDQDRLQRAGPH